MNWHYEKSVKMSLKKADRVRLSGGSIRWSTGTTWASLKCSRDEWGYALVVHGGCTFIDLTARQVERLQALAVRLMLTK